MKQKLFFASIILLFGMQSLAANLVICKSDGTQQLQDIAVIGKLVFLERNIVLLDKNGDVLAEESVRGIRKIVFATSGAATDHIQDTNIVVYPNPTHDMLLIKGIEEQTLRVYDMHGHLLKITNGTQVSVGELMTGTYLLQIGTQVVRFIKQ